MNKEKKDFWIKIILVAVGISFILIPVLPLLQSNSGSAGTTDTELVEKLRGEVKNIHDVNKPLDGDIVYGKENTRVVVEYASLSCPHCAVAHREVVPALIEMAKNGEIQYIHRHLPLNGYAMRASMLADCTNDRVSAYNEFYKRQKEWLVEDRSVMTKIASEFGGLDTDAAIEKCLSNKEAIENMMKVEIIAESEKVKATPTFVFNGRLWRSGEILNAIK